MEILVSKDSKGKYRVVEISSEWDDERRGYCIRRCTYQLGGKQTTQPEIWIHQGKVKRTVTEQAKLEFDSHVKKYQDKGYKLIPHGLDINDPYVLAQYVPDDKTDANGVKKPMLAKDHNKVATSALDKPDYWWASRKLNGVRCSFYYLDNEVKSASRGGGHYDNATKHIRNNPKFINYFINNPDAVLDGELYIHGRSLQYISGLARTEVDIDNECDELQYYIYDLMDGNMIFDLRKLELENNIKSSLEIDFEPNRQFEFDELKVQMVPHEQVSGWTNIKALHDKYVKEGFEGIIVRHPDKPYGFGKRTNDMIKIKEYQDAEFEITGISEGLRDEDMCFTCITDMGVEFKAKPMGSREVKDQYREDLDSIIGKKATVKFFEYSDDLCPVQPVLICIRDYE